MKKMIFMVMLVTSIVFFDFHLKLNEQIFQNNYNWSNIDIFIVYVFSIIVIGLTPPILANLYKLYLGKK